MLICIVIIISFMRLFVVSDLILPIHIGNVNDENFDTTKPKEEIKLDDFFWTGSGDYPPEYLKSIHTGISKGKDVIVKTETVVATVYIENDHNLDSICLDCVKNFKDLDLDITVMDRRYWLLTVLFGYYHPLEYPILEERLAKLYRLAFTRQQSHHLGIINYVSENITSTIRKRRQIIPFSEHQKFDDILKIPNGHNVTAENKNSNELNISSYSNRKKDFNELQNIKVVIHNVSLIKEDDVKNWIESRYENIQEKKYEWPFVNQTELIYSVFMNGNPVLATAAADDVKYISDDEVTNILKNTVFMKAEPYLKEPQATPLVPASSNVTTNIISAVTYSPLFIAISSVIILLLLLLIIILLLTIRAKRKNSAKEKKLSSHQRLLSEHQNSQGKHACLPQVNSTATITNETGTQNFGYEQEYSSNNKSDHGQKVMREVILPPSEYIIPSKNLRPSSSETTGTSDSSVYCPINKPNLELHAMIDEKSARFLTKKTKNSYFKSGSQCYQHCKGESSPPRSNIDTVQKKRNKKIKHKKKYLLENRVGFIEEPQSNLSDTSISTESLSDTAKSNNYDNLTPHPEEVYNPNTKYNRNKIFQNHVFMDKTIYDTVNESMLTPKEAINQELIKSYKLDEKSSESCGSIGSFLSMTSLKSFPKSVLPEPLQRVLEPVTVTHYDIDHCENSCLRSVNKQRTGAKNINSNETIYSGRNSHSDNPDPGVIGPVVWEIHKKKIINEKIKSPEYEPAVSRSRFEGLLESAIQLYSTPEDLSIPPLTNNIQKSLTQQKESRGKSAIITGNLSCMRKSKSNISTRPLTADHSLSSLNHFIQTQPPTPNEKAWESRVSSPLIRPLSAGPFHKPETPLVNVTRVLASQSINKDQISAAPLIEAIQNELKKFKRENTQ